MPKTKTERKWSSAGRHKRFACEKCGKYRFVRAYGKHQLCQDCAFAEHPDPSAEYDEGLWDHNDVSLGEW